MFYERFVITKQKLRQRNPFLQLIAGCVIWSVLPFALMLHASVWIYQQIYFSIFDIPKIRFRDYCALDRFRLKKLNWVQYFACIYCEYSNSLAVWLKAVANQTEVYSCAIKHSTEKLGQEHQKDFFECAEFQ